jgi:HSP20 family protein
MPAASFERSLVNRSRGPRTALVKAAGYGRIITDEVETAISPWCDGRERPGEYRRSPRLNAIALNEKEEYEMAKQDTKTSDQQNRQSQGREMTRSSQPGGMARRTASDSVGLSPSEFMLLSPFSLMRRMMEEFDNAFRQAGSAGPGSAINARSATTWSPAIEVQERDGNYVVRVELPGLKPDEVTVVVTDGALVIEGERRVEREEDRGGVHRTEIQYGRFYRSIPLPEGAEVDQANARFEDGVLEIVVPVPAQQSAQRQIPIQDSSTSGKSASQRGG